MSALARIHIGRKTLGYESDDEGWRDLVERVTGRRSTRGLTPVQSDALIGELDRLTGGKAAPRKSRSDLSGPYAPKLRALWIAAWNLGAVRSRSDQSLIAFAKRQTGVDHPNWLRDAEQAAAVIEALKAMCEREGVYWGPMPKFAPPWRDAHGYRIAAAQWRKLARQLVPDGRRFDDAVREHAGKSPDLCGKREWIAVMNAFGTLIRFEALEGKR